MCFAWIGAERGWPCCFLVAAFTFCKPTRSVRDAVTRTQELQTQLNILQKEVISQKKKQKLPCDLLQFEGDEEVAEANLMRERLKKLELETASLEANREEKLKLLGNFVDPSVPCSNVEDDNEVVACWPEGTTLASSSDRRPESCRATHDELLWRLLDYTKTTVSVGEGYGIYGP
eukprot:symbB.v1.2.025832.t2/scaffold2535.1/size76746/2